MCWTSWAGCPRAATGPGWTAAARQATRNAIQSACPGTAKAGYLTSEGVVDDTGCTPASSPFEGFWGMLGCTATPNNPAYLASEGVVDETGCAPGGSVGSLLVSFLRARSSTME